MTDSRMAAVAERRGAGICSSRSRQRSRASAETGLRSGRQLRYHAGRARSRGAVPMSPSLTLLLIAALTQADPTPAALYETLVSADHWREQAKAVHALGDLGEVGLPLLIRGTQH